MIDERDDEIWRKKKQHYISRWKTKKRKRKIRVINKHNIYILHEEEKEIWQRCCYTFCSFIRLFIYNLSHVTIIIDIRTIEDNYTFLFFLFQGDKTSSVLVLFESNSAKYSYSFYFSKYWKQNTWSNSLRLNHLPNYIYVVTHLYIYIYISTVVLLDTWFVRSDQLSIFTTIWICQHKY